MFVNGEHVSDATLIELEQRGGHVQDGRYWYDRVCGAWGLEGGPTAGFIQPGLKLGGPLKAEASNGSTGVYINGRQLHAQDVAGLQKSVGTVMPGRWWVDAQGNFGMEGGAMLGNLWFMAQMRNAPAGSSSHHSSSGNSVFGSDGSSFYFQGKDAAGNVANAWSGG